MTHPELDPRESLETIRKTLQRVRRFLYYPTGPIYKVWGLTLLVTFLFTHWAEHGGLAGSIPGAAIGIVWVAVTGLAAIYTILYFRRQPVKSGFGARFAWAWAVAFTIKGFTVGSFIAAGLPLHGAEFGIFAVHTVVVIYLVGGALLWDNLQFGLGIWFGLANIVSLQLGLPTYALSMGILGGGGLLVAGFIADRIYRVAGVPR